MTDLNPSCRDCAYLDRRTDERWRCRSPQLLSMRLAGILCAFERDPTFEEDRGCISPGRKCGPEGLNYKRKEAV